ncbi:hemolysin [Lampropedia cohaerens]|uniref:Hemolysin n=1 Tax=Lampropedia cohaerens TaxID=1610491 RepID=A0A0U1Q113_9BURK|nr:TlyA family RNA methyltransferase [Lampropedia cohaerens]KKW68285.1 hemolysin [Lampropedia cohaerens]
MRADQRVVDAGLAGTRSLAQRLIRAGAVDWRLPGTSWQLVRKNGETLPEPAQLRLRDAAQTRYVSRGGLKLEGALHATGLNVAGWHCLDVGQSTGGFTDCLLQRGARHVTGVDVGHGQLHPAIAGDVRVRALEGLNARQLSPALLAPLPQTGFDLIVADLSFISLTLVLPAMRACMAAHSQALLLVKPQFELQPEQLGKGGIVRDAALYAQVRQRIASACAQTGLQLLDWFNSPIEGGDGNREFFVWLRPGDAGSAPP